MKFVVAVYGSRGDVEPCIAVGLELARRGHAVHMAVPPTAAKFTQSVGLNAVPYGLDMVSDLQPLLRDADFVHGLVTKIIDGAVPELMKIAQPVWETKTATLTTLARGADLLVASVTEQELAAGVAEFHDIPLAALHFFPAQVLASGLSPHLTKLAQDAQRCTLGLPKAAGPHLAVLELQTYDEVCFPQLAADWAKQGKRRPFVGALRMGGSPVLDEELMSWIAASTPPIYFGFGSTPIADMTEIVSIISGACVQLGERALVSTGGDNIQAAHAGHVKICGAVDHSVVFPACRAVVHHGGAGTTNAGLRAGVPTLVLWSLLDQPLWADVVERLKVGCGRAFIDSNMESLVADLRRILTPECITRAREVAAQMTEPTESVARTADLLEVYARREGAQVHPL